MGMFKDLRNLRKQAEAMVPPEYRGIRGGYRHMQDATAHANQVMADLAKAQELQRTGHPGTATITAIRDTGMTINDNPVVEFDLQVTADGNAPYPVTHRQATSRLAIGAFQPGATVPVHIDPANPHNLVIG